MKEIITIQVSKFLTTELVEKIAQGQWKSSAPHLINRSRQYIFDQLVNGNDCFGVVAINSKNEVVGRIHCVKNESDPFLWYYGDLFVIDEYRGMGVAKQMIYAAINHLSDVGASKLRCYVEPTNFTSRQLQVSMGFEEKSFEGFNHFTNDGQIMYEINVPSGLTTIEATVNEAYFVRIMFVQNKEYFTQNISINEWKEILGAQNPDEKHFLICKGAMPVGYIRISGLLSQNNARISMLFIAKDFHHQGIGTYALHYAEQYAREKGFSSIKIEADIDHLG